MISQVVKRQRSIEAIRQRLGRMLLIMSPIPEQSQYSAAPPAYSMRQALVDTGPMRREMALADAVFCWEIQTSLDRLAT
jgi:hypothetical protein